MQLEARFKCLAFSVLAFCALDDALWAQSNTHTKDHGDLVALFQDWRAFEEPERREGATDYSAAAMATKHEGLKAL